MAFTDALFSGRAELDGVLAKHAQRRSDIRRMLRCRKAVPVSDAPIEFLLQAVRPDVLVDARMRKRAAPERQRGLAPVVIGLGPNFRAGENVDIAVETAYGAQLGAVIESGETQPLEGEPRELGGHARDRFIYASHAGTMRTTYRIGDHVEARTIVGVIDGTELPAPLSGWLRGLARDGAHVEQGNKVVEIDPIGEAPRQGLGERPRRIAEGVLDAIERHSVPWLRRNGRIAPFGAGAAVATLGGLIGLGGAESWLPVLVGLFKLGARDAILANVVVSLVTVVAALHSDWLARGPSLS